MANPVLERQFGTSQAGTDATLQGAHPQIIETGIAAGAPKLFSWFAAFGLMVTIIWLYVEILRLLAILANRR